MFQKGLKLTGKAERRGYTMGRLTELCAGDECGGKVMLKTDMTKSCYGDWYCNDCMFKFMAEQEQFNRDMVGGDDPCEYE